MYTRGSKLSRATTLNVFPLKIRVAHTPTGLLLLHLLFLLLFVLRQAVIRSNARAVKAWGEREREKERKGEREGERRRGGGRERRGELRSRRGGEEKSCNHTMS
jgi:hypothetical protein